MKTLFKFFLLLIVMFIFIVAGCQRSEKVQSGKLQVVTSLFPLYDFSRSIAGEKADVTLLLPPAVEPHSFEPKPADIVKISKSGMFIYTGRYMEPWVDAIIKDKNSDNLQMIVVEAAKGVNLLKISQQEEHHERDEHHHGDIDPHVWLDFDNAKIIVTNILDGFIAADPSNADYYRKNAAVLVTKLSALDAHFKKTLSQCESKTVLHGGHYTFGYMAKRYALKYQALSGVSSEAEPSAARMSEMLKLIKSSATKYIFTEELLSPRLTETLAAEAKVKVLKLNGAHNLGKDDFQNRVTFFDLMERNLENLKEGLSCIEK